MSSAHTASRDEPKRLLARGERLADDALMTRDQAQAIIGQVKALSKADEVLVSVGSGHQSDVRFAANQMSTAGSVRSTSLAVTSVIGRKHATAVTTDLSIDSIRRVVEQSERLAKLSPDDPEWLPVLGPQRYLPVQGYVDATANVTAADRARAALTALGPARKAGDLQAAGFLLVDARSSALGTSKGLFAYHRSTSANYTLTVRTADGTGSGWAGAEDNDWRKIDFAKVSNAAIEKARLARNPVALEPGRYTVILEPQAVGDLVSLLGGALQARLADEGRSAFAKPGGNKLGERIMDPRVTIISDPQDPQMLLQPFGGDGLPSRRMMWIENGVLKELSYSRFWARKQGKEATPSAGSIKMLGGPTTTEEMIRSTPRGILVTRLWYLRSVDPRTILYTGLTRDGVFLIENGKITKAIKNFRFNESPLFMLNNVEAIGPAIRIAGAENNGTFVMPTLKVREFNFTSSSDAV
ncbi:MAG TPA: TldD/PmbA family protein [Gemmatimonadaceae bacterium]|nr:TldD/PmbA family protein [Gemmatimonadaceae bacterium]